VRVALGSGLWALGCELVLAEDEVDGVISALQAGRARLIERWRPRDDRPEVIREQLEWRSSETAEPLAIDLAELFADPED
jgi:hypothetical protein